MISGWAITIDDYLAIVEMAKRNGKKPGDSMQEEFVQYIEEHNIKKIGDYPDKDMLIGNMREKGFFKILDLTQK